LTVAGDIDAEKLDGDEREPVASREADGAPRWVTPDNDEKEKVATISYSSAAPLLYSPRIMGPSGTGRARRSSQTLAGEDDVENHAGDGAPELRNHMGDEVLRRHGRRQARRRTAGLMWHPEFTDARPWRRWQAEGYGNAEGRSRSRRSMLPMTAAPQPINTSANVP
jgi:hypothetical protein